MKKKALRKRVYLIFSIVLFGFSLEAQIVNAPRCMAVSNSNVRIKRIEINDDNTVFHLNLDNGVEDGFIVPSSTYIISADGGDALKIVKVKGIELDREYRNANKSALKLYFPRITNDIKKLTFRSGSDACNWNFYEIDLGRGSGARYFKAPAKKRIIYKDGKKVRLVEQPHFKASSASNLKLKSVEMSDEQTILSFSYTNHGGGFSIPRGSCIQEGDGGELLFVKRAEGTNVDEKVTRVGTVHYKLFFPPVSEDVKKIHFKEANNGGNWFVFDIDVRMD